MMKAPSHYGEHIGEAVLSLCEHQALLPLPGEKSAKHASGVFGEVELLDGRKYV